MSSGVSNQSPLQDESITPSQVGILQLNNASYKMPPDLAIVVQRNVQSSYFQAQSYSPGATMVCIVNSGASFVNLRQSFLVLDVQNTSTGGTASSYGWFGVNGGSSANLLNRIQIISRSGVVLERIDNCNQLSQCKVNYAYSQSWANTVGSAMGVGAAASVAWGSSSDTSTGAGGAVIRFMIPLYVFSTFCESMDALCPSQLLAGSRFEILLESPSIAMMDDHASKTLNYQVVACRIDFESYLLTDSVMRVLNQISSTQGLEVVSATTQDTQGLRLSASGGSQIVVDVAKSCSRALSVIYKERLSAGGNSIAPSGSLFDNMASAPIGKFSGGSFVNTPKEWQVRAGQLYFPQASIRGGVTLASSVNGIGSAEDELYVQTLRAFQKFNPGGLGQLSSANSNLFNFRGTSNSSATDGTGSGGTACFALDLQRSAILTSGIPLSNSRQLTIQYSTNVGGTYPNYLVDVFLTYQVLVRVFLSQAVLEV